MIVNGSSGLDLERVMLITDGMENETFVIVPSGRESRGCSLLGEAI